MENKKYNGYTLEDFLEDREFIFIVKNLKTTEEWELFLQIHIESRTNILRAKKIIEIFETTEGKLQEEKKYRQWKNISTYNKEFKQAIRLAKIKTFAKVAASVIIILSIGSVLYLGLKTSDNQYQFARNAENLNTETPILILPNGDQFNLEKNDSKVAVLKGQDAIWINNDNIVKVKPVENKIAFNEIIIPFGKKSSLLLEDGTKVWLNAGSRFAFPQKFDGKKREVFLEGEGYFEVAKNINQPFIVNTIDIDVEVLGTKFNLSAYKSDDFIETVLLEGSVNILERGKIFNGKVLMVRNQKATFYKEDDKIILKDEPLASSHIVWIEGWYQFSNENIKQVLNKLERYYNIKFSYDQEVISKALPVTGKLDLKESLDEVLTTFSKVAKIDYRISGNQVIIAK